LNWISNIFGPIKKISMKSLVFAVLMFVGLASFAQDGGLNLAVEGGAQIEFVEETVDYGTILQGADGNREFVFKNTGKEPLIISSCKGSCGCTVPKCPSEPVLPGETAKIKVKYDTNRLGKFTKSVTVTSNAGEPVKTVKITGNVVATMPDQAPE
jgi:hypothetical protein